MGQQATNVFELGLNTDLSPLRTGQKTLKSASNIDLMDGVGGSLKILQKRESNDQLLFEKADRTKVPVTLTDGYIPLAVEQFGGIGYIISFNEATGKTELGTYPSPDWDQFRPYAGSIITTEVDITIEIPDYTFTVKPDGYYMLYPAHIGDRVSYLFTIHNVNMTDAKFYITSNHSRFTPSITEVVVAPGADQQFEVELDTDTILNEVDVLVTVVGVNQLDPKTYDDITRTVFLKEQSVISIGGPDYRFTLSPASYTMDDPANIGDIVSYRFTIFNTNLPNTIFHIYTNNSKAVASQSNMTVAIGNDQEFTVAIDTSAAFTKTDILVTVVAISQEDPLLFSNITRTSDLFDIEVLPDPPPDPIVEMETNCAITSYNIMFNGDNTGVTPALVQEDPIISITADPASQFPLELKVRIIKNVSGVQIPGFWDPLVVVSQGTTGATVDGTMITFTSAGTALIKLDDLHGWWTMLRSRGIFEASADIFVSHFAGDAKFEGDVNDFYDDHFIYDTSDGHPIIDMVTEAIAEAPGVGVWWWK